MQDNFFELYDSLLGGASLSEVLDHLTNVVRETMRAEGATVYLVREESRELEAHTLVYNVPRTIRVPISSGSLAGHCAVSGEAFLIPDAYGDLSSVSPDLSFDRSWDEALSFRTRDVMCAPALLKGETVGVVQVLNSRGEPFAAADLESLQALTRLVGYALHHARMYDDLASMKQLQREKAKFMMVMVHELKSPLAAAKMMADMVVGKYVPSDRHEEYIVRIAGRLDNMLEMITDTLAFSRLESGQVLGDVCVSDIREIVTDLCGRYEEDAQTKGLAFERALGDEPVNVRIDTQGFRLVISNLLSNAIKYTPEGSVSVRVWSEGGQALFSVTDTGMGIPEADIPKLFGEFFRASNAKLSDIEGTGVGLAGVKSVVERFGGELRLETKEGEGSCFEVRLPVYTGETVPDTMG